MTDNPLLTESGLPYGAPQFDKIRNEHYLPAFREAIKEAKSEIDAIVSSPELPTFANTIEALEYSGKTLGHVSDIFFNILEADADDELQQIAEEVSPMMTEYSMYVSLNPVLFSRVKAVYDQRGNLELSTDRQRLLEETYKSFSRQGANLSDEDKKKYSDYMEELSLLSLKFGKNVLAATNSFVLHITDGQQLAGLPDYLKDLGRMTAKEKGLDGWAFTLDRPSYGPFMQNCEDPQLRKQMYLAYNTRAVGGENDNTEIVRKIAALRHEIARLLGYDCWADYVLEENMAKNTETVMSFLEKLITPSLPFAKREVQTVYEYAVAHGFREIAEKSGLPFHTLMPWDFSYYSEKLKHEKYSINDELLKPYFKLENVIDAVFHLADTLYGLKFQPIEGVPVYHKDVKVYDVKDANGRHMALFYADFFPRESKRGGAWMTSFREQGFTKDGKTEERPFISIVTNFTKPTETEPSLLTFDEVTTFLHEFGHALHGILAEGKYSTITGTNVARDFVELPSQIMENWATEKEYLASFAKNYKTGEVIPDELVDKIVAAKNYNNGYASVRQLSFGIGDMAWHSLTEVPSESVIDFEKKATAKTQIMPYIEGTAIAPSFSHIFAGGYSAGYYSYKWAEVLEADAFELFKEKGVFNKEVADSFRENILSKGNLEDADVLYRNFRGRDPEPEALLKRLQ